MPAQPIIAVSITHGAAFCTRSDIERATRAAYAIFQQRGDDIRACWEAYQADRDRPDDGTYSLGAMTWQEAENAAETALTEGWPNPDGAGLALAL